LFHGGRLEGAHALWTLLVNTSGALWAEGDFTAPATGTYTVLVNRTDGADGVGTYALTLAQAPGGFVVPAGDDGGPIANGANVTGTILRGDLDQWTFPANAGDAVSVTASEVGANTPFQPGLRVHGPTGQLLVNTSGDISATGSF